MWSCVIRKASAIITPIIPKSVNSFSAMIRTPFFPAPPLISPKPPDLSEDSGAPFHRSEMLPEQSSVLPCARLKQKNRYEPITPSSKMEKEFTARSENRSWQQSCHLHSGMSSAAIFRLRRNRCFTHADHHEKGTLILLFASRFMEIVAMINTVTVSASTLRSSSLHSASSPCFLSRNVTGLWGNESDSEIRGLLFHNIHIILLL